MCFPGGCVGVAAACLARRRPLPGTAPPADVILAMATRGSSLAKLVKLGAAALQPSKGDNGVWRKAALSARSVARLRKEALLENRCVRRSERWWRDCS